MKVAVVGATGLVGQTFIKLLEERNFPIDTLYPFASKKSKGKKIEFKNVEIPILTEEEITKHRYDIAFFSAGSSVATRLAGLFVMQGALVIDNSSAFRMEEKIPLVVPEINGTLLDKTDQRIIANPNCSTIQMVMILHVLRQLSKIKRVVVTTFQSVSGSGTAAINELHTQMEEYIHGKELSAPKVYPWRIFNNSLPHIDRFMPNGYTFEEEKMMKETTKILGENIPVTATCVRVPVFRCHSESVNIEFHTEVSKDQILAKLSESPGIVLYDNPNNSIYPLQGELTGTWEVHVGRIRRDPTVKCGYTLWCSADNIMKGAALNGIQIAERYLK